MKGKTRIDCGLFHHGESDTVFRIFPSQQGKPLGAGACGGVLEAEATRRTERPAER